MTGAYIESFMMAHSCLKQKLGVARNSSGLVSGNSGLLRATREKLGATLNIAWSSFSRLVTDHSGSSEKLTDPWHGLQTKSEEIGTA